MNYNKIALATGGSWVRYLILLIASFAGNVVHADSCPDVAVPGDSSMDGYAIRQTTFEKVEPESVLPLNTELRITGHAVATGYCDIYVWSGSGCVYGTTELREVTGFNNWQTVISHRRNLTNHIGVHYTPLPAEQDFDGGTEDPNGAPFASFENEGGVFKYVQRENINTTACDIEPSEVWEDFTIYILPELRCNGGDDDVGNPCDAGTGNKGQRETDYDGSNTGLTLTRTYNSLIPINFGFGHGWATPFHKRIERYQSTRRVRRGSGVGDVFQATGGTWVGPPDSAFTLAEDTNGYTVALPDGATERYDLSGRIQYETNRSGLTTIYGYDSESRLASVTGPFGHVLTFAYNADGEIESVTDPAGETISYQYDSGERLTQVTFQDGTYRQYHYEISTFANALTGITDENFDRYATFGYASGTYNANDGKAILTQHAQTTNGVPQEKFSLVYNTATKTTVTDPAGNVWVYNYVDQHNMKKLTSRVSQTDGKALTQVFDANNNLTSRTDEAGRITTYTYNSNNQRISMTEASGAPQVRTTTYSYLSPTIDLLAQVSSPSVSGGSNTRDVITTYDSSRNIIGIAEQGYTPSGAPVSRAWAMDYNTSGQVVEIDGPRTDVSDITTLSYYECITGDECGQLASVTNALGHTTTFDTYDAHGRVTHQTDPNGIITTYAYDLRGRVTTVTQTPPIGAPRTTTYTYDNSSQIETATAPNGTTLTYDYDAAHDLRSITDNFGNKIEYTYDTRGNRASEDIRDTSNVLRHTVAYTYDLRSRIDTINAAGSVTDQLYDAIGNLTDETDPNTNDTEHEYDPLNRLTETIDALSGATTYAYDKNDRLTVVEAPNGASTVYVYDDLGNLLSVTSPDSGTTTYAHDAAGNRLSQTDANGVTAQYSYDALNRLTVVDYPNSTLNVDFTYDQGTNQKGRLTTMADGSGTTTFGYDVFGNVVEEEKVIGGNTHVTAYSYDAANLLESMTYPSGRVVDYTRNALGQVMAVETTYGAMTTTVVDDVAYEPFGPLSGLTFGNGLALGRSFDQQYRLAAQTTGAVQDLAFTLDAAGNIDAIDDGVNASFSQDFTHDALHRIDSEDGAYGSGSYTYDANGNRLTKVRGLTTQVLTYTANSNRLATHDGNTVTLDAAGNTTADPAQNVSFTYGDHNRMLESYVGGILKATYVYDGEGQRVKKVEATGAQRTTVFHYGISGELIGETIYDSAGAKTGERDYIWLESLPIAQSERIFASGVMTSSQFVYLHGDQLDTPRLATNDSQTVVWRWDSDAFGVGAANTDPDADTNLVDVRLKFPGQYIDEEAGVHYNYFRDYDPVTGRYVESDPIGLHGGINTYAYAYDNPVGRIDPRGLQPPVAAAGRAGWIVGEAAATGLNAVLIGLTGTTLGGLIYEMCNEDSEEARCKKVYKDCAAKCADTYADDPESLPGTGSDLGARVRRCIAECVAAAGCSPFMGR